MADLNKSYYAIIPANIRYDNDISSNEKLLYCEITALCNEKGYCWANNEYFAELYAVSERTISRWISKLIRKGYIIVEFQYKSGSREILRRYIKLSGHTDSVFEESTYLGGDKIVNRYGQSCHLGGDKNVRDNNINNNNIINNNILSSNENEIVDKSVDNFEEKPNKCAENNYSEFISKIVEYLNQKCSTNFMATNKKTKACITARFNEGYKLEDFSKVIDIKSAEWLNNPEMSKYLRPETLFGNKFEGYLNQKKHKLVKIESQKPANKFHNFDQRIASIGNAKLEEMVKKRFEEKLKSLKGSDCD